MILQKWLLLRQTFHYPSILAFELWVPATRAGSSTVPRHVICMPVHRTEARKRGQDGFDGELNCKAHPRELVRCFLEPVMANQMQQSIEATSMGSCDVSL